MPRLSRRSFLGLMGTTILLVGCGSQASPSSSKGSTGASTTPAPTPAATTAAAAKTSGAGQTTAKPVLIGAGLPLSGPAEQFGKHMRQGYELWAEEINGRGGLLKRPVQIKIYDDRSEPEANAKLYEKLISEDKVDLLFGPYSTDATLVASTTAEQLRVPMLASGGTGTKLWTRGYKYTFGLFSHGTSYSHGALEIAQTQGLNSVALVADSSPLGIDISEGAAVAARDLKLQIVEEVPLPRNGNLAEAVSKLKAKNPRVVVFGATWADPAVFLRQAKAAGLTPGLIFLATGPDLPEFGKLADGLAENVVGNSEWEPAVREPGVAEFVAAYTKKYGIEPGYHAAGAYAAGQVVEAAVKRADSVRLELIRDAYARLSTGTIIGPYLVDNTGQPVSKPNYTIQWQNGKRVIIWPNRFTNNTPRLLDWK